LKAIAFLICIFIFIATATLHNLINFEEEAQTTYKKPEKT